MGDPAPELREGRTEAGCTGGDSAGSAPGGRGSHVRRRPFLPGLSHREVAGGNQPPATSAPFGTRAAFEDGSGFPRGYGLGSAPAVPGGFNPHRPHLQHCPSRPGVRVLGRTQRKERKHCCLG